MGSSGRVRVEKNKEKKSNQAEKKKPKNRMGQRARQRLAEKQYGKDRARHILENRARDQKRREQQERKKAKVEERTGSHHNRKPGIAEDDPATLHPSWQAKKATQKLVIPDISAATKNPANKIVFDA